MASPHPETIGLIGVGLAGSALAERLLAGGFHVLGYDADPGQQAALAALGGTPAGDVGQVFAGANRIVLSLPDASVVATVVDQARGLLRPGQILVDTTTGDPASAAELGRELQATDVAYLDTTLSGSSVQIRHGEATLLVGGTSEAFERCQDLFQRLGRRSFFLGSWGAGSQMKLVSSLVLGLNRAALAEGLFLAKRLGFDLRHTLGVLRESPAYSRVMDTKGEKMVNGDFTLQARLSQHLKDVRLMLECAAAAGVRLPLSEVHSELLYKAEAAGLGGLDNSAILRAFEEMS